MLTRFNLHWLSICILSLAILLLFWPALLHPDSILFPTFSPFSDVMVIHWPKAQLLAQSWSAGEGLPLWTPLILSGMPLAANQLAMLFYPPAWLFLFLPVEPVFNILFIFHLLLGGSGVYLLLYKAHHSSPQAALFGSLTFALNGKWLAHAAGGHVSMVGAIGWLPWAVFGMMMLLGRQGSKGAEERGGGGVKAQRSDFTGLGWGLLAALALTMQIFTHTLLLIYTVYLLAALVVWRVLMNGGGRSQIHSAIHSLIRLFTILVLAGLVGAVQLWPLLELSQFSNRTLSLVEAVEYSVTPAQLLLGLLLPLAQSSHELVIYLGLIPLLLALFGVTRSNRWSWFYAALVGFAVLFALGPTTPVHALFYAFVPGFGWVRTPARIFFVISLAVAVLAGFGVDRLAQQHWSAKTLGRLTRLAVALGAIALLVGLGLAVGFGQTNRATVALTLIIPLGLAMVVLWSRRVLSNSVAMILLGLLLVIDLALFGRSMMRFVSPQEALAPGRRAAEYLAQQPGLFRIYSPSYSLPMQTAAAARLQLADGVEPVHLAAYDQFMARAGGYNDSSFSVTIPNFGNGPLESALQETEPDLKLLGLLNVEYLAAAFPMNWPGLIPQAEVDGTFIYRNEHALPRAWVAHQTVPAQADWLAQLAAMPELDCVVIVDNAEEQGGKGAGEQRNTLLSPFAPLLPCSPSPAKITAYSANRIDLETTLETPGWLVLSEIWYPGWQAMVNGQARPVIRVDGLLRGVYLAQPGDNRITLEYRPRSVVWGGWISALTAVGLLVGGFGRFWYARRRQAATVA